MTRLVSLLVVVVALAAIVTSSASAAPTRARLWNAMHAYSECRAVPSATFAGDLSSAKVRGPVAFETLMSNKAALVVHAGNGPHVVEWITSHGVRSRVFRFRHLDRVAARLHAITRC